ncbi:MAG: tyrosine-type recombinase/integrase [Planctomycetota bacterium]|nr:tyrosine-type recombinase/integrase [Planctomycetota bacterium]
MSIKTEESYLASIRKYLSYFKGRGSKPPKEEAIAEFLTFQAVQRHVAINTQRSLLNGIMFMYREVFGVDVGEIADYIRSTKPQKLPVVYTQKECLALLDELDGTYRIMVGLLYGAGLWRGECASLRIKDIDFEMDQITVRQGKNKTDRVTMMPKFVKGSSSEACRASEATA